MESNRRRWRRSTAAVLLCAGLAGLAGCGRFGGGHSTASAPPAKAAAPAAATPAKHEDSPDTDMVTAMSPTKGDSPVTLRFALRQRPEVGQPVELDLEATPAAPVDRVTVSLRADDGLAVRSGAHWDAVERPEVGVPFGHSLTIVPSRDGIFSVMVTVLTDSQTQSVTRVFMIPVIAGSGIAPESAAPVATAKEPESTRAR